MPRDGPKAVPKGKGPVSQEETKIEDDIGNAPEIGQQTKGDEQEFQTGLQQRLR